MRPIDADALEARMYHEAFEKDNEDQRWDSGCWIRYRLFEKVLREAPNVEPEQKTGKWINGQFSECGCHAPFWSMASTYRKSNYCPDCGVKMEVEE